MVIKVGEINSAVQKNTEQFVLECNKDYSESLNKQAEHIAKISDDAPIVLISGPSGSGKTTTALTIENILDNSGHETHTVAMDNYFKPMTDNDKALFEQGEFDLESPSRVDKELLNEHLIKMIKCEPVELPKFDFTNATRSGSGRIIARKPGEPIVLEGIHVLNPDIIEIPDEYTYKIYISVRTRVKSNNTVLHPSYIRLMRRMIRDKLFRARTLSDTIKMFKSVERGAARFIMPYKFRADANIDTFIPYELAVYKPFLYEDLKACESEKGICDMLNVLSAISEIDENIVPKNSLIREFIGNSDFEY